MSADSQLRRGPRGASPPWPTSIRAPQIQADVDRNLDAGLLWPEPRIGLNRSLASGGLIDEHVESGLRHAECSKIFRKKPDDGPEEALSFIATISAPSRPLLPTPTTC